MTQISSKERGIRLVSAIIKNENNDVHQFARLTGICYVTLYAFLNRTHTKLTHRNALKIFRYARKHKINIEGRYIHPELEGFSSLDGL